MFFKKPAALETECASAKDDLSLSSLPPTTHALMNEERAERLRIRKEKHAAATKQKEKEYRRKEKIYDHAK
ncbi:hypothetical protein GLAREA_00755 [Glarea lozoyensis ATCC 20868]|uniref:Uncharacterized protein n=1 Tax=Glarea lozoyensis (strain ATCC 20868 / MF5171) TaxID=1116229 RepID=S3CVA8_GLAL2|nr:uncharacterized protein GLAREA_00755 [Glarea lozoyensis ATCC 20868]EPE29595.1 hypothetical protein GLAREA_00755 [Glarea lozoyensis ATCC 20868]